MASAKVKLNRLLGKKLPCPRGHVVYRINNGKTEKNEEITSCKIILINSYVKISPSLGFTYFTWKHIYISSLQIESQNLDILHEQKDGSQQNFNNCFVLRLAQHQWSFSIIYIYTGEKNKSS
jgi:hypothetical protein